MVRIFNKGSEQVVTCPPSPTQPAAASGSKSAVVQGPAEEGDYRESWGKVEPWKATGTADAGRSDRKALGELTGKKGDKPGVAKATDRPGMASVMGAPGASAEMGPNAFGPIPTPAPMGPPPVPPDPFRGRQYAATTQGSTFSPDQGIPSGLTNAFTHGGNMRPIPADFGVPVPPENAFQATYLNTTEFMGPGAPAGVGAGMPAPTYPVPAGYVGWRPGCVPVSQAPAYLPTYQVSGYQRAPLAPPVQRDGLPEGATTSQLFGMLKDSLYPSQREWAADCLSQQDWRAQPQIIVALVRGAKEDPAPAVRAGCVRALGHMKVNTLPIVQAVQSLKYDRDPRVRHEVEEALAAMGAPVEAREGVRPASATTSEGRLP
jgi:hypothetical protein